MTHRILREQRSTWKRKPVTRVIYTDFYHRIVAWARPGLSLEIGGGSGNLKEFAGGDVISTDILSVPWLDATADAQLLPFSDDTFMNIVAIDVIHHIERPRRFLSEAKRTLQSGGRLLLIEPAITPVSWLFYKYLHREPIVLNVDPLADGPIDRNRRPFDANQAIPTLLFRRYRRRLEETFPEFKIIHFEWMSLFAYPLSGGFRRWSLIPAQSIGLILKIERALAPLMGRLMAFRLFVIIEKI
jgi:SAM-dependent methyltransferase